MRMLSVKLGGGLLGILAITATMLMPTSAEAQCDRADITGNYQAHIEIRQDRQRQWATCGITVRRNGTVRSSGSCSFDDGSTASISGGKLRVNSACRVSGRIKIGTKNNVISNATMNLGKDLFTGVGALGKFPTTFTAVKL